MGSTAARREPAGRDAAGSVVLVPGNAAAPCVAGTAASPKGRNLFEENEF